MRKFLPAIILVVIVGVAIYITMKRLNSSDSAVDTTKKNIKTKMVNTKGEVKEFSVFTVSEWKLDPDTGYKVGDGSVWSECRTCPKCQKVYPLGPPRKAGMTAQDYAVLMKEYKCPQCGTLAVPPPPSGVTNGPTDEDR
jgi:ribosomal protein S27AE